MSRVMLVGLPKKDAGRLEKIFSSVKISCETTSTMEAAYEKIVANPPALIVAEKPMNVDVLHGLQAILKTHAPVTPFLVSLSVANATVALECLRAGAFDCLSKPYSRLDVLAAAKRASLKNQRTLFTDKIGRKKRRSPWPFIFMLACLIPLRMIYGLLDGPPPNDISLGSANLSGIQWDGRALWVGDWFDSTLTHYNVTKGVAKHFRKMSSDSIFKIRDAQPILVCNTPETFFTIGSDLKLRSHHRASDMPTLNTVPTPGNNPTGLAWTGKDLWSVDSETNVLYRHGADLKVVDQVKSLIPHPAGLTAEGESLWVVGGMPLKAARLDFFEGGSVWSGPYSIPNALTEGVAPSGLAAGFGRMWFVSGGDPRMTSISLHNLKTVWAGK